MKTVILAAGFGSRLWPLSTSERPKQFQKFIDNESLLQYTYRIMSEVTPIHELYILTLSGLEHLVVEQLPGVPLSNIIIAPARRNTLPHTLYALRKLHVDSSEHVLFTPVDHYLVNPAEFSADLNRVIKSIDSDSKETHLLASRAETIESSLGYIRMSSDGRVLEFIEKPNKDNVNRLRRIGGIYINTLRYVTSIGAIRNSLKRIHDGASTTAISLLDTPEDKVDTTFLAMPTVDISYGLFEKTNDLRAIEVKSEFIDIGKFATLYKINQKDSLGNVIIGSVTLEESRGNFIVNQLPRPLVVINTIDTVIVQTEAGTVFAPMDQADKVGATYKKLIHQSENNK